MGNPNVALTPDWAVCPFCGGNRQEYVESILLESGDPDRTIGEIWHCPDCGQDEHFMYGNEPEDQDPYIDTMWD